MPDDIEPLVPPSPTPHVREKRHYPSEQQQQQPRKKKQSKQSDESKTTTTEETEESQTVDINEKDGTVIKHFDDYA